MNESSVGDSSVSRLTGVLMAPVETFQRIAARPSWLLPLIVTIVAGLGVTALMMPKLDLETMLREQLAEAGSSASAEQIDSQVETMTKVARVTAWVGPFVLTPAAFLFLALVFWGTASIVGGQLRYKQSLAVVAHSWMPQVIASLLSIPVILSSESIDPEQAQGGHLLASHLGFLADRDVSPVLHGLLSSFDVFSLWSLVLLGVGLAAAGKLSRGAAAVAVLLPWLVWVVGKAGFAALPALMRG